MATPKINLLPHRDERAKAIKKRYSIFLGVSFALGVGAVALVHSFFGLQISQQQSRNDMLTTDIASLDKQIDKIKQLRQEIAAAVSRKQVVESLQANRSRAVMLLNQIVQPPANIFYQSIVQKGDAITLSGIAPSNTSVSSLIKQIETSDILLDPKLVETKTISIDGAQLTQFIMNAKIIDLAKIAADREKNNKNKPAIPATPEQVAPTANGPMQSAVSKPEPALAPATPALAAAPALAATPTAATPNAAPAHGTATPSKDASSPEKASSGPAIK